MKSNKPNFPTFQEFTFSNINWIKSTNQIKTYKNVSFILTFHSCIILIFKLVDSYFTLLILGHIYKVSLLTIKCHLDSFIEYKQF